jgi:hypothetical protein
LNKQFPAHECQRHKRPDKQKAIVWAISANHFIGIISPNPLPDNNFSEQEFRGGLHAPAGSHETKDSASASLLREPLDSIIVLLPGTFINDIIINARWIELGDQQ